MKPESGTVAGAHELRQEPIDQSMLIISASLTALRSGPAPATVVWPPVLPCRWKLRLAAHGSLAAPAATVVHIEHDVDELAETLSGLVDRPFRLMAWTYDEIAGYPRRLGYQWTRITADDLLCGITCRRPASWVTCLTSTDLEPLVEVTDLPSAN